MSESTGSRSPSAVMNPWLTVAGVAVSMVSLPSPLPPEPVVGPELVDDDVGPGPTGPGPGPTLAGLVLPAPPLPPLLPLPLSSPPQPAAAAPSATTITH